MRVLWRTGKGSVDQVRAGLVSKHRGAYTTIQTVLNRLVARGLLRRQKVGKTFVYSPEFTEAEYLAGSLTRALSGASKGARVAALANLVDGLDGSEMDEINALADEIAAKRDREP